MSKANPSNTLLICSLFPVPCSLFPVPCSLFPVPCSLFPVPCPLSPVPCPLFPVHCPLSPVPCSLFLHGTFLLPPSLLPRQTQIIGAAARSRLSARIQSSQEEVSPSCAPSSSQ